MRRASHLVELCLESQCSQSQWFPFLRPVKLVLELCNFYVCVFLTDCKAHCEKQHVGFFSLWGKGTFGEGEKKKRMLSVPCVNTAFSKDVDVMKEMGSPDSWVVGTRGGHMMWSARHHSFWRVPPSIALPKSFLAMGQLYPGESPWCPSDLGWTVLTSFVISQWSVCL